MRNLRASLQRAWDSGRPDAMALQRYDIRCPPAGSTWGLEPGQRPNVDEYAASLLILDRVEDVTH